MPHDIELDALQGDLEALRIALDEENHTLAESLIARHEQRLRDYITARGADAPAGSLQLLLEAQQSLMADMQKRRDIAAEQLRANRQSVRAANAYHQAESLA